MTRALVEFINDKGMVICRMYRNGDGFPWDFGVVLAEFWASELNFDGRVSEVKGAEMENRVANCVASFVADNPDYVLLIADNLGWGEDYRYQIQMIDPTDEDKLWPKGTILMSIEYPTLAHNKKTVTVTPQAFLDGIKKLDEGKLWKNFDDHQEAFESVFDVETVQM